MGVRRERTRTPRSEVDTYELGYDTFENIDKKPLPSDIRRLRGWLARSTPRGRGGPPRFLARASVSPPRARSSRVVMGACVSSRGCPPADGDPLRTASAASPLARAVADAAVERGARRAASETTTAAASTLTRARLRELEARERHGPKNVDDEEEEEEEEEDWRSALSDAGSERSERSEGSDAPAPAPASQRPRRWRARSPRRSTPPDPPPPPPPRHATRPRDPRGTPPPRPRPRRGARARARHRAPRGGRRRAPRGGGGPRRRGGDAGVFPERRRRLLHHNLHLHLHLFPHPLSPPTRRRSPRSPAASRAFARARLPSPSRRRREPPAARWTLTAFAGTPARWHAPLSMLLVHAQGVSPLPASPGLGARDERSGRRVRLPRASRLFAHLRDAFGADARKKAATRLRASRAEADAEAEAERRTTPPTFADASTPEGRALALARCLLADAEPPAHLAKPFNPVLGGNRQGGGGTPRPRGDGDRSSRDENGDHSSRDDGDADAFASPPRLFDPARPLVDRLGGSATRVRFWSRCRTTPRDRVRRRRRRVRDRGPLPGDAEARRRAARRGGDARSPIVHPGLPRVGGGGGGARPRRLRNKRRRLRNERRRGEY